jgi:hypothetical protein
VVQTLDWPAVLRVGGSHLEARLAILRAHYKRLRSVELPARSRVGSFEVAEAGPEFSQLVSYSEYDPVSVPTALLPALGHFDGRPTRRVLRTLSSERGVTIDEALLRRLVDYQILI